MKKLLFSFLLLLTTVVCRAEDFEVDGIYYNITSAEELTVAVTYNGYNPSDYERYSGSVVIPESVVYDGETYSVTEIGYNAFANCSGLTSITIPNSVIYIYRYVFRGCSGLTSVVIPNSVMYIGENAFVGCSALESVVVTSDNPIYDSRDNCNAIIETSSNKLIFGCKNTVISNSVTMIGEYAFYNCSSLTSIAIPNSVTTIGSYAFFGCSGLTSVTIPNSVIEIGGYAFSNCSGLESIIVPNGNPIYDSRNNCNAIIETSSNKLIFGCKNTVIPNSVTMIGGNAFYYCSSLTSLTIPNSVTTIGYQAFYRCSGLTSVTIPNSVTEIGGSAFEYCRGLTSLTIPNSVTTIGEGAFYGCRGLTSVSIGNSVTEISYAAFGDCTALKDVYCLAESVPTTAYSAFEDVKLSSATLHVPAASLEDYSTTSPWSKFGQIVAIGEGDGIEQLPAEEEGNPAFKNPTVYDLSGHRVSKPRKGIYVIGGRKTVVK